MPLEATPSSSACWITRHHHGAGVDARAPHLGEGRRDPGRRAFTGPVIYTGAVDELFAYRFGRLPYRTLEFPL